MSSTLAPLRRPAAAGWAAVLALHAALLLGLLSLRPVPAPRASERAPVLTWVLPAPAPVPAAAPTPPPASPTPATQAPRPTPPAAARPSQAITWVPAPTPSPAAPSTAPQAAASAPAAAAPLPLNLSLPRDAAAPWRQRNPALDDPRLARERRGLEDAIARAMGGDNRVIEERVDLDTVRIRSGNRCVLLKRSRAGQLDLGGGTYRELWQSTDC